MKRKKIELALERINFNQPVQDANNWHSASSSSGHGTPTGPNSQQNRVPELDERVQISHEIFSLDNDGVDDLLFINYQFPELGHVCNITVFDAQGRTVKHIARNVICGINGQFRWDGLDNNQQPVGSGLYGITAEVFNLSGKTSVVRNTVGLTRRF